MPNVRTFAEQGVPNADAGSWYGFVGPAGTLAEVRDRLAAEIVAVVRTPEVSQRIAGFGWNAVANTPAEFWACMRAEYERYGKVTKSRGIRLE